ncbi:MAG: flavin-containing monooxygenase [Chloroflexota bacterium]
MADLRAETLIIGASAAGLAVARCLQRRSMSFVLLEKNHVVGGVWRKHYDRLHLHTSKGLSALPDRPFARDVPKYPARDQLVVYLEAYARDFDLAPRFGEEVVSVRPVEGGWQALTADNRYRASNVVIATGYARKPHRPTWPDMAIYGGELLHSSEYRSGAPFAGQKVLVAGCGNSGAEIALDLAEHGARPALAVRGPIHVVPRDLLGLPILTWSIVLSRFPPRVADFLSAPLIRLSVGDLSAYGLRRPPYGPLTQIAERGRIPVIDVGTVAAIKDGRISVYPGVERFTDEGVVFVDGQVAQFDAMILATGYCPALADFLEDVDEVTDEHGVPRTSGEESDLPGLYFCGFYVSPAGMLHEIATEAPRIAGQIAT